MKGKKFCNLKVMHRNNPMWDHCCGGQLKPKYCLDGVWHIALTCQNEHINQYDKKQLRWQEECLRNVSCSVFYFLFDPSYSCCNKEGRLYDLYHKESLPIQKTHLNSSLLSLGFLVAFINFYSDLQILWFSFFFKSDILHPLPCSDALLTCLTLVPLKPLLQTPPAWALINLLFREGWHCLFMCTHFVGVFVLIYCLEVSFCPIWN